MERLRDNIISFLIEPISKYEEQQYQTWCKFSLLSPSIIMEMIEMSIS